MPPPTVTLAICLRSITERYGAEFAERVKEASGQDGECGMVWMTAGEYADLLREWATEGEGQHAWPAKPND